MYFLSIPTQGLVAGEGAASIDGLKPLVGGEAVISDVFHQLLLSIQALQLQVAGATSEGEVLVEEAGEGETGAEDVALETVAVNVDAPKGLQNALESLKAAIESQKELATLPQQVKAKGLDAQAEESMSARVAMQKLDELLLGYEQDSGGDGTGDDQSASKSKLALADLLKPLALNRDAPALQFDPGAELVRSGSKGETPQVVTSTSVGAETTSVKEGSGASESQATSRLPDPPTIRTVGDFTIRSVRHLLGSEQESIQIRLVPRSLGELHISVTTVHDKIEVTVTAASGLVRDVLDSQLAGLKDALARDGVEVSRISVHNSSMANLGGQFAHSQAAQRQAHSGQHGPHSLNSDEIEELSLETVAVGASHRGASHDGDLDMRA